jgi:hypothetical protein
MSTSMVPEVQGVEGPWRAGLLASGWTCAPAARAPYTQDSTQHLDTEACANAGHQVWGKQLLGVRRACDGRAEVRGAYQVLEPALLEL